MVYFDIKVEYKIISQYWHYAFFHFFLIIFTHNCFNLVLFSVKPWLSMELLSLSSSWQRQTIWETCKITIQLSGQLMPSSVLDSLLVSLTYSAVSASVLLVLVAHCLMLKLHPHSWRFLLSKFSVVLSDFSELSLALFKLERHESKQKNYTRDYERQ